MNTLLKELVPLVTKLIVTLLVAYIGVHWSPIRFLTGSCY